MEITLLQCLEGCRRLMVEMVRILLGCTSLPAMKAVLDAWDQAVRTRAPELKILVGPGKPGTQLKRKITKGIEDE